MITSNLSLIISSEREHYAQTLLCSEWYDRQLIHAIESVIIDWSHQIRDVLKRDSAQPLIDGLNPTPRVEVEFWKAKCDNLECIYDQLRNPKVCSIDN